MIHLTSDDVPTGERVQWWRDTTALMALPTWITTDPGVEFSASAKLLQMGDTDVAELQFSPLRSVRDRRLIQRSDPELWELVLVRSGTMSLEQGRNELCALPGDLVLYDTSRPFDSRAYGKDDVARIVVLHLSRHALPVPEQALRNLVAQPLPAQAGAGAVLRHFLAAVIEEMPTLEAGDTCRLGSATTDIASSFLAGVADAEGALPLHIRQQALLHEIKIFISRNLGQPLSPAEIAAAHHISVRYLHHLFRHGEPDGRSVGEFTRELRLKRCATDLTDPRLAGLGVAQIGARWAYLDAATFSRAFKARYGLSPREYRKRHLGRG